MSKHASLTLQTLIGVALPFVLVTALIGAIAYWSAKDEISEVYDSQLISSAQGLWKLAHAERDPKRLQFGDSDMGLSREDEASLDEYSSWRSFRVWRDGRLVLASGNAPSEPVPNLPNGFATQQRQGQAWRVFTYRRPADHILVEVAEQLRAREEISGRIVWGVSLPLLFVLPVIAAAVWLGIRWGLRDLRKFAAAVRRRSPQDLTPVVGDGLPAELTPLSESINHLLSNLTLSRDQERLFTDNAAHELRTPLAALGVQAEVARNAKTDDERQRALDALLGGVRRTSRLLDQLLTLARITHNPSAPTTVRPIDVAREVLSELYAKAQARGVELVLNGDEALYLEANPYLLGLLFSNLIDNAIKHAPAESRVETSIHRSDGGIRFHLRDYGPGIAEAERDKVFGRFYRVKGNTQSGSGLGLAIVRTICDLMGAEIRLDKPASGPGLEVLVIFSS